MSNTETSCLNHNSLIPAIKESERFINFLNVKFSLNLPKDFIIVINKANKNALGMFSSVETKNHFINTTAELNTITLNTLHLKECNPFEVLAHELAHYVNYLNKIKDCSSNQYHNKHFKKQAEMFLLTTQQTKKGYITLENDEFNAMVNNEFKGNKEVFNVFQAQKEKKKVGSRLRLYTCECGIKLRVAKDNLNAVCLDCNTNFKKEEE